MSYNTRRTGGAANRPSPTTQVNYHQQPARTAAGNAAQQNRSANVGYSTTQQPVTYNSSAQPAYSTPTPPLPPTQPKPAAPAPAQQQAPPPPPSTPAVKPPITPANTPNVKQEPVTPATPADTTKMDTTENGETGGHKLPFWKRRPLVKVSNKVRRARQNAKLRRILNPKNALTFLNELRPGTGKFVVREDPNWGYMATVEVDGKTFTGHGLSASKAKVQASERALKFLLLEQLTKSEQAAATETKEEAKEEDTSMDTEEQQEGEEPKGKKPKVLPEDDVPWGSLAAFALHKLFMEWQKQGPVEAPMAPPTFPVEKYDEDDGGEDMYFNRRPVGPPEFGYRGRGFPPYSRGRGFAPYPAPRGPPPPGYGLPPPGRRALPPVPASTFGAQLKSQIPTNAAPMKKIPDDANQRHPVMLLNQLKPNVIYNESREGEQPRVTFIITIDLDGKQYVGRGRNKKEAKKQAAKAALAPMGILYSEED